MHFLFTDKLYDKFTNMNPEKLFDFLDEIPCDNISELGDVSEDEIVGEQMIASPTAPATNDVFDIENMPIIFSNENHTVSQNVDADLSAWSSEDELPLSIIRAQEMSKKTIWTKSVSHCVQNFKEFGEETGPNISTNIETPTDMFLHIFPERLVDHIVFQTNLYALQKAGGNNHAFTPTNAKEIKGFIAINLIMGIKKLPSYKDYWSSRFEMRDAYISSIMSRDRFSWILTNLHLNDNSLQPNRNAQNFDKLYKLRPLLDVLSVTYKNSLKPSQHQAVDESMIRFKGRSSLKQYMPNKPVKRGYKVWIRSDKSGYVCQFQIYTGKVGQITEKCLGARVIRDLTRDLVGKGYEVYFDNYFNSVELQKQLKSELIYACGTVRKGRRDLPTDLINDKLLKRGEVDWRVSTDGLTFLKWMDNRPVHFLTNYMDPSKDESVSRKKKDGSAENVACPELVKKYNIHMGYVDKMDMLKTLYEVDRKSKKWWHRIFFYFIDISLVNAFILYQKRTDSNAQLTLKLFRLSVGLGLVGAEQCLLKKGRPSTTVNHFKRTVPYEIRYDSCSHMPFYGKTGRCGFCSTKSEPHKSRWHCTR